MSPPLSLSLSLTLTGLSQSSQSPQSALRSVANDRYSLWKLGISHVVNAAHGRSHSQGCPHFYGSSVDYYGVPADDSPTFDLSPYFFPSADYIKKSLDGAGGKRSHAFKTTTFVPPDPPPSSSSQPGFWSTVPSA